MGFRQQKERGSYGESKSGMRRWQAEARVEEDVAARLGETAQGLEFQSFSASTYR